VLARFAVQRQPPVLVALADDVDPSGAGLEIDALPGERHQLVAAQSGASTCDAYIGSTQFVREGELDAQGLVEVLPLALEEVVSLAASRGRFYVISLFSSLQGRAPDQEQSNSERDP
jgi:hypothetical protein